jgi:hypothetical protein
VVSAQGFVFVGLINLLKGCRFLRIVLFFCGGLIGFISIRCLLFLPGAEWV